MTSRRPAIEQRFPRPSVMGVVNVTPDSFSDGGVNFEPEAAIAAARRMVAEGAAIVDVGGESTRPGSEGVSLDEELRRVLPVLEAIAGELPVSIDTAKAGVARRALALGAELVNDVTALRGDPDLAAAVAEPGAYLCLMHMQGEPRTMQVEPRYDDVVSEVAAFLEERLCFAVAEGIAEERICLDPGIGFGKTVEHNFELLRRLDELVALGRPVVIGFSRKRSLGRLLGDPEATTGPLSASLAAAVTGYERGATILRVHDVREHVEALAVARAVNSFRSEGSSPGRAGRVRCKDAGSARIRSDTGATEDAAARRSARPGDTASQSGTSSSGLVIEVELRGLELHGRHGAEPREREHGQRFLFDLWLGVPDTALSDRLEDTVDYREVARAVREVSDARAYVLLEALAAAVADELLARFALERVRVRVRKPDVELDPPVEFAAATVERPGA